MHERWWCIFLEFLQILFQGHLLSHSLQPCQDAKPTCSLLSKWGARPPRMGSISSAQGGGSGFFKYRGPWARSAAPPTGWCGLLHKFDCSSVPIFLGVQGWDLATWNKREAKVEFLFLSWHHTQIVTMLHQLHLLFVERRGASGVTLSPTSFPPFLTSLLCWMKSSSCLKD